MPKFETGQTYGRVKQNAFANRIYYKPSLRKPVIRHPGVMRRSLRVIAINKRMAAIKPAARCKDKPWDEFTACMSEILRTELGKPAPP